MYGKVRLAHFYRKSHGDAGYPAFPLPETEGREAEELLSDALLARFNAPRRGAKPPHTVDLTEEDGTVVMRLYVVDPHRTTRAIL